MMKIAVVVAILIFECMLAFSAARIFRYDLVSAGDRAYKLDRWTGKVEYCLPFTCSPASE